MEMITSMDLLSNPIFIPLVLLLLLLIYIYHQEQKTYRKKTKKNHPTAGTVFQMLINFNRLHDYMTNFAEKHKTFRMINPLHGMVYTCDPANVEYILKTNFQNYGKGKHMKEVTYDLLSDGIFTVDGDKWREQRKLSSHEFSTKILRDYSSVTFRNNTVKLGNILLEAEKSNQTVIINDLFLKTTMDSIFKVAFGIDLDNMGGSSEEGVRFSCAFDDANTLTYRRFVDLPWKIKKYLNIGSEAEMKKNMQVVDEFVYKVIQKKIEQMHKSKDEESVVTENLKFKKEDVLSRFLHINDKDPKHIRDVILNFVLAGKDPIALSMSWFIYMLCKHPEIQEKVAKEIKEATNIKEEEEITSFEDFAARVSDDALDKMQYLHAALTETIRMYPALPVDPKICYSDDVLPDGYKVNKGDEIAYMPYATGMMKFIWGDDVNEFKPRRWLDENGCFRPDSPFKFTAFQAGPRACLGRDFAYRQMKIFSSILLGCFVFKLADENKVPRYKTTINLHIDGPLEVYVSSRFSLG